MTCTYCERKGATVGCCQAGCEANYHFRCGLEDGASYFEDKTVYCEWHASAHTTQGKALATELCVWRTAHVDLEESRGRRTRRVDLRTAHVRVGGLTVESLGVIEPRVSDAGEALVPVGFVCSRLFWSHVDPFRVVRYRCRTRMVMPDRARKRREVKQVKSHCYF